MSLYPVVPGAGDVLAGDGLMVAVRLEDVASPLRNGALPGAGSVSALVVGGTGRIRPGEPAVFCKVVAVAPAVVRRDGKVQAAGQPGLARDPRPAGAVAGGMGGPGGGRGGRRTGGAGSPVREGREGAAADQRFHDPGYRADDPHAGRGPAGGGHGAGRRPRDGAVGAAVAARVGAGARRLAERARPGTAGGTAGRRPGGLPPGARSQELAGGRRRPAHRVLTGRDPDPRPGHAREPARRSGRPAQATTRLRSRSSGRCR